MAALAGWRIIDLCKVVVTDGSRMQRASDGRNRGSILSSDYQSRVWRGSRGLYAWLIVLSGMVGLLSRAALAQQPVVSQHSAGRGPYWTTMTGTAQAGGSTLAKPGLPKGTLASSSLSTSADLVVDSLATAGVGTDASLCANGCFAQSYAQSTVPYISLDAPRNITLQYSSELAAPRPIAFVDVHINPTSAKTLKEYWFQVKRNGVTVAFLNGDTKLRFAAPSPQSTTVRLAGQYDNRTMPTQLDSLVYTVTAVWSDNSTQVMSFWGWVMNLNERTSPVGKGWIVGGMQRLTLASNGRVLITNGDGSAGMFTPLGGGAYHTETNSDFSLLTSTGSGGSTVYTRTYPDSSRVQFDNTGKALRSITSTLDTTSFGYDGSGRLTAVYDPFRTYSGGTQRSYIALHYTVGGLLDQIQEPGADGTPGAGRLTNITIATSDSTLTAIQDPDGVSTNFRYNANTLLEKIINRRGDTSRVVYNANSWLLDSAVSPRVPIDAGGGSTTNQTPSIAFTPWQSIGIPASSTATTAATPVAASSILMTVRDPLGRVTTMRVNLDGQPIVVNEPLSHTTTIVRDGSWTDLPTRITHPNGGTDTLAFTANTPNLTRLVAAGDSVRNFHYGVSGEQDSTWTLGQLARRDFLNGTTGLADSTRLGGKDSLTSKFTYDTQRRLATAKDVSGHQTGYHYDPVFGNVDSASVPGTAYMKRLFDAFGRDTAHVAKGAMYWERTKYDTLNRVIKVWHKGFSGDTVTTTYDAGSFVTRVTVPRGTTVYKTESDALGRPTKQYDGVDTTKFVSYRYDLGGRMTSWTNRRTQRVDIVYDSLNRVIRQSGTTIPTDTFTYAANNRIQTAQRGSGASLVALDSTFVNLMGAPDSVVHRVGGHRYAVLSTQALYTDAQRGTTTLTSDAGISWVNAAEAWHAGSTSRDSVALSPGAGSGNVVWTSNRDNVPTQVQWPSGPTQTTGYTSLIQPYTVSFGGSGTLNDSLARDYQRDTLGRLAIEWRKTGSTAYEARKFIYDSLGRLTKVQRVSQSGCTVTTDSIIGAVYSCTTTVQLTTQDSMGYDAGGNRNLPGATFTTTGNRLLTWPTASGTITYTYDADGNLATRAHSGVTDSLFWSATNQLDSVRSGGLRRQYEYNSAGYLTRRSTNGSVDRLFVWDADQLQAELDATGTHRRAQYLYHGGIDQPFAIATDSGTSSLVRYVGQDQQGNVTGVFRNTTLAQYTRYTSWGQLEAQPINTLADTNRLGWKGLAYDADSTKLYFMRHRWYDPQSGRFISEDPIGLSGGSNLFSFASGDPVDNSDPTGMYVCFRDSQSQSDLQVNFSFYFSVSWALDGSGLVGCIDRRLAVFGGNGTFTNRLQDMLWSHDTVFVRRNNVDYAKSLTIIPNFGITRSINVTIAYQSLSYTYSVLGSYPATQIPCENHKTGVFTIGAIIAHELFGHAWAGVTGRSRSESFAIDQSENIYHLWKGQPLRNSACYAFLG